jgi:peptidoglycan/xylan/chitin deacetylase (PgdA/CDA1 family)
MLFAVVSLLLSVLVLGPATPAAAASCENGRVALTFDDGPSRANARRLLEILDDRRARATFFLIGRNVAARPGRTRRIARAGHRIYNHTYSHVDLTESSNKRIRRQVRRTERAFTAAGVDSSGRLVRPPYGAVNARVRSVLRDIGFRTVLWTVDTRDWDSATTSDQIVRRVVRGLAPGANILMHDQEDTQATLRALPRVIRAIRSRDYCLGVVNRYGRTVKP